MYVFSNMSVCLHSNSACCCLFGLSVPSDSTSDKNEVDDVVNAKGTKPRQASSNR